MTNPRLRRIALPLAALGLGAVHFLTAGIVSAEPASSSGRALAPIPSFARMYGTTCSTCHTAAPKLNVLGEAFRLNGYRMPDTDLLVRQDDPVPLGAPEWDEAWPRTILSSELPGTVPLALRVQLDGRLTRDDRADYTATTEFPHELYFLAGAPLSESMSTFLEIEWEPDEGVVVKQAMFQVQDVIPALPERSLNLWLGLMRPRLLNLAARQIDQAGRQAFTWQSFDAAGMRLTDGGGAADIEAPNALSLDESQAAVELNGLAGQRLFYGFGVTQGLRDGVVDRNAHMDLYYKLRYKIGGIDLAGEYAPGDGPVTSVAGQLLDRSLVVEHFGYFGNESTPGSPQGGHQALGVAVRLLLGRLDLGAGYVRRSFDRPWSSLEAGRLDTDSYFGKAEYVALPWLIGSLKAERFDAAAEALPGFELSASTADRMSRILPGAILLIRQNVRLVVEGEIFTEEGFTERTGLPRPHNLWARLDLAF